MHPCASMHDDVHACIHAAKRALGNGGGLGRTAFAGCHLWVLGARSMGMRGLVLPKSVKFSRTRSPLRTDPRPRAFVDCTCPRWVRKWALLSYDLVQTGSWTPLQGLLILALLPAFDYDAERVLFASYSGFECGSNGDKMQVRHMATPAVTESNRTNHLLNQGTTIDLIVF